MEELKCLWNPGLTVNGILYRCGLVSGIWDGKGYEKVTKTQGGSSGAGCNTCEFPGVYLAKTEVYPFASMYCPAGDPRRLKRPPFPVKHHRIKYNLQDEFRLCPRLRTYTDYLRDGRAFLNRPKKSILAVNGVKGIWAFDELPYAHMIWKCKDYMHSASNSIQDTINLFKPSVGQTSINRTEKTNVRNHCKSLRIFPFLYALKDVEKPDGALKSAPWCFTTKVVSENILKLINIKFYIH